MRYLSIPLFLLSTVCNAVSSASVRGAPNKNGLTVLGKLYRYSINVGRMTVKAVLVRGTSVT